MSQSKNLKISTIFLVLSTLTLPIVVFLVRIVGWLDGFSRSSEALFSY